MRSIFKQKWILFYLTAGLCGYLGFEGTQQFFGLLQSVDPKIIHQGLPITFEKYVFYPCEFQLQVNGWMRNSPGFGTDELLQLYRTTVIHERTSIPVTSHKMNYLTFPIEKMGRMVVIIGGYNRPSTEEFAISLECDHQTKLPSIIGLSFILLTIVSFLAGTFFLVKTIFLSVRSRMR